MGRRRLALVATFGLSAAIVFAAVGGPAWAKDISEAQQSVDEHTTRPKRIAITEPVGKPIPKDKTIYWLQCTIPACTQLGDGLKPAAKALGWDLEIIDIGLTPETVKAGWERAARDKPDGVIAAGFPTSIFADELKELTDAGVPIVNINVTDPPTEGVTVVQGEDAYHRAGALLADALLASAGDDANTLFVTSSAFPVVPAREKGFEDRYKELCPKCGFDTIEADPAAVGKELPTQIVGYLQANPDVKNVAMGVGDFATGVPSALAAAGLDDVEIVLPDINPAIKEDIINDGPIKTSLMMENVNMMWEAVDILARQFAGVPLAPNEADDAATQLWLVNKDNVKGFNEPFPIVKNYQKQYKKLWGVS